MFREVLSSGKRWRSYQLLNASAFHGPFGDDPVFSDYYFSPDQDVNKLVITPQNEWLVFTIQRIPDWHTAVSLCYDSFISVDVNVTITADRVLTEPELTAWNGTTELFGAEEVIRQLGVPQGLGENQTAREIMTLETTPQQLRDEVQLGIHPKDTDWSLSFPFPFQNFIRGDLMYVCTRGFDTCDSCMVLGIRVGANSATNLFQQQIFQEIMRTTADSALAWQAFFTLLGRMAYYAKLPYFDVSDGPIVSWFQSEQFPRFSRGFKAVVVVVGLHLLIVTSIAVVFVTKTKVSCVGDNAWQCLPQLNSDEADEVFRCLTMSTDGDVKKKLVTKGMENEIFYIERVETDQDDAAPKVGLRRRREQQMQ